MIPEAADLLSGSPVLLQRAFAACYSALTKGGCTPYVKTIYVGFTLDEEMVAAIYPRRASLEIALALPEDVEGSEFKDATHLTWPTLPVSIEVASLKDARLATRHLGSALERIKTGAHTVRRPNEHFRGRKTSTR